MLTKKIPLIVSLVLLSSALVVADDLTKIIQEDLSALGYDTGNTAGDMTTATAIAISKFQAEHNLEVTGEPSPQLAGIVKATIKNGSAPVASSVVAAPQPAVQDEAALRAAQQACLQEKVAAAQASQKKKRGFGSLIRAVTRTASQMGGSDLSRAIAETSYDVYNVNATAADLESAAKDLGLTEDQVEACRNPSM